ncbi:MAG: TetR family transcriptional regulator [Desulfobacterales bacterium]|nr:TetR family transcriptional regulator [Desulfobacterales bacterium]
MANTKETITDVAVDLFHQKGYFATSISDIAKGSGIQKAGIYYYFKSKEALLFHIMMRTMDELMIHLEQCLEGVTEIESRMRAAVHGHVDFHLRRQKENFIANSELRGLSPDHYRAIVKKRDAYEQIFQGLMQQGRDTGVFAKGDVRILSYAILTLCTAGAFWFNPQGRLSIDEIARMYEDFVLNGLKHGDMGGLEQ